MQAICFRLQEVSRFPYHIEAAYFSGGDVSFIILPYNLS